MRLGEITVSVIKGDHYIGEKEVCHVLQSKSNFIGCRCLDITYTINLHFHVISFTNSYFEMLRLCFQFIHEI